MVFIPIAEYMPDMPDFNNPGSGLVQNLLPRTEQSYAPFPGLSVAGTALTARCQGAYSMVDNSGNSRMFAGDATKLYRMTAGDAGPVDVSGATYTTGADERWSMTLFGTRVIATNYTDPIQSYVEGSSSVFANLISSGVTDLTARYIAVVKDWVVVGNTTDGTDGVRPQRVRWCAIDDPTNWPALGSAAAATTQSDAQGGLLLSFTQYCRDAI